MSEPPVLLDASALLALLLSEPGADIVRGVMSHSSLSAINYTEVLTRLIREGEAPSSAIADLEMLDLSVIPWDQESANSAADLSPLAKTHGLSLGDRACLATARRLRRKVLTSERKWRKLPELGIDMQFIR